MGCNKLRAGRRARRQRRGQRRPLPQAPAPAPATQYPWARCPASLAQEGTGRRGRAGPAQTARADSLDLAPTKQAARNSTWTCL